MQCNRIAETEADPRRPEGQRLGVDRRLAGLVSGAPETDRRATARGDFTLPQFTGVLAHEFGHFAQKAGLRSFFPIQTIQDWFARVVHQRDHWDEMLETRRSRSDWRIRMAAHIAAFAVGLSRRYLTLPMKAGAWIASGFSREMEYDADRYEAAIAGVDVFEQTSRRLPLPIAGVQLAWQDTDRDFRVGRLPDNIAELAATRTALLNPDFARRIGEHETSRTTGLWDTHPCTADRVARVRRDGPTGVLDLTGPASRLFRNLPELCRQATQYHYTRTLRHANPGTREPWDLPPSRCNWCHRQRLSEVSWRRKSAMRR